MENFDWGKDLNYVLEVSEREALPESSTRIECHWSFVLVGPFNIAFVTSRRRFRVWLPGIETGDTVCLIPGAQLR